MTCGRKRLTPKNDSNNVFFKIRRIFADKQISLSLTLGNRAEPDSGQAVSTEKQIAMTIKQLSVFIENKTGRVNEVTRILADNKINMSAFSLVESAEFGILRLIVSDVEKAREVLKAAHFGVSTTDVIQIVCPNAPGAMHRVLEVLAREEVFIEYMYAFSQGEQAQVVIRPTDVVRASEILRSFDYGCAEK
jgi:hypothetical protein